MATRLPRCWAAESERGRWTTGLLNIVLCLLPWSGSAEANSAEVVFRDKTAELKLPAANAAACWADFDNGGWVDVCISGDVWKNHAGKSFSKVADIGSSVAADFDNDGLFRNNGQFALTDVTGAAQLANLQPTYQAAWADYANDGDLDLLSAGKLFENQGNDNSWLKVRLEGDGDTVNRSAIGAQTRIKWGDKILTRQVEAGTGEGNQNDITLHFGLGSHKSPVSLDILWPNKSTQTITNVEINQLTTIRFKAS